MNELNARMPHGSDAAEALELAKEGKLEIKQSEVFAPIQVRRRKEEDGR